MEDRMMTTIMASVIASPNLFLPHHYIVDMMEKEEKGSRERAREKEILSDKVLD